MVGTRISPRQKQHLHIYITWLTVRRIFWRWRPRGAQPGEANEFLPYVLLHFVQPANSHWSASPALPIPRDRYISSQPCLLASVPLKRSFPLVCHQNYGARCLRTAHLQKCRPACCYPNFIGMMCVQRFVVYQYSHPSNCRFVLLVHTLGCVTLVYSALSTTRT